MKQSKTLFDSNLFMFSSQHNFNISCIQSKILRKKFTDEDWLSSFNAKNSKDKKNFNLGESNKYNSNLMTSQISQSFQFKFQDYSENEFCQIKKINSNEFIDINLCQSLPFQIEQQQNTLNQSQNQKNNKIDLFPHKLSSKDFQNQFDFFMNDQDFIQNLIQNIKIGPLNLSQRQKKLHRFIEKKNFKNVRQTQYELKKKIASQRLRYQGRFINKKKAQLLFDNNDTNKQITENNENQPQIFINQSSYLQSFGKKKKGKQAKDQQFF